MREPLETSDLSDRKKKLHYYPKYEKQVRYSWLLKRRIYVKAHKLLSLKAIALERSCYLSVTLLAFYFLKKNVKSIRGSQD